MSARVLIRSAMPRGGGERVMHRHRTRIRKEVRLTRFRRLVQLAQSCLSLWMWTFACNPALGNSDTQPAVVAPHPDSRIGDDAAAAAAAAVTVAAPWSTAAYLVLRATQLLDDNYCPDLESTIPSPNIDAHQESTTSVMVAQAWARFDQRRARAELLSIFHGQWENGMVPNVRYATGYDGHFLGGSCFPGPTAWGNSSGASAGGANTSAVAALPLHAEAALRIFDLSSRDAEARLWLQQIFPPLFRYHDYLHGSRADEETGLVYVHHPWETEVPLDSPTWPELLKETRARIANESWVPPSIPEQVSSAPGFPGEEVFEAALYLTECAARQDHVDSRVRQECPFLLQDVQFNAALMRSDKALLELAGILEATRSGWQSKVYTPKQYERIQMWAVQADTGQAMEHFWSDADTSFLSRYISAEAPERLPASVRPAASADFSALLAPGLVSYHANAAVEAILSPGELSFRCGDYPIPEVECGHLNANAVGGGKRLGEKEPVYNPIAVRESWERGGAGEREFPGELETASASLESEALTEVAISGAGRLDDAVGAATVGALGTAAHGSREARAIRAGGAVRDGFALTNVRDLATLCGPEEREAGRRPITTDGGNATRRVWVFHNYLAGRGLRMQSLPGLTVWLTNSTLDLMAPGIELIEHVASTLDGGDISDRGSLYPDPAEEFTLGLGRDDLAFPREDSDGNEGGSYRFHRAFDGDTGLPAVHAEGNSSSLAAATAVLLLLGDGPDGGNDFPPVTHATLFVMVAIELVFSFAMGVSCLVFSLNLVRKLREDEQQPALECSDISGADGGTGIVRRSTSRRVGRGGSEGGSSSSRSSGGATINAINASGGATLGVATMKGDDSRWASGAAAIEQRRRRDSSRNRGIGSLLRKNAGSRTDLYEDSDDDYLETAPALDSGDFSTVDAGADELGRLEMEADGRDGDSYITSLDDRRTNEGAGRRARGRHVYRSLPPDGGRVTGLEDGRTDAEVNRRTPSGSWAGMGRASNRFSRSLGRAGTGTGLSGEGPEDAGAAEDLRGRIHRGSDDRVGYLDALRPFYASLKFW